MAKAATRATKLAPTPWKPDGASLLLLLLVPWSKLCDPEDEELEELLPSLLVVELPSELEEPSEPWTVPESPRLPPPLMPGTDSGAAAVLDADEAELVFVEPAEAEEEEALPLSGSSPVAWREPRMTCLSLMTTVSLVPASLLKM